MDKLIRTIKAVSIKKKDEGQIGFMTEEDELWYNISGNMPLLDQLLKDVIAKGNLIEFEMNNGFPQNFVLKEKASPSSKQSSDMVTFETLLDKAHKKKECFSVKTELVQVDIEKKFALFKATVSTASQSFDGYGDAMESNVEGTTSKHWFRIAETRAIVRALKLYTNNATCSEEEK